MKKENDSDLVVLNEYFTDAEAYIAKGVLETNGIPCVINNEIMSSIYPLPVSSVGGVRLLVFRQDFEAAQSLLGL